MNKVHFAITYLDGPILRTQTANVDLEPNSILKAYAMGIIDDADTIDQKYREIVHMDMHGQSLLNQFCAVPNEEIVAAFKRGKKQGKKIGFRKGVEFAIEIQKGMRDA